MAASGLEAPGGFHRARSNCGLRAGPAAGREKEKTAVAAAWMALDAAADAETQRSSSQATLSYLTAPQLFAAAPGSNLGLLRTDGPAERQQKRTARAMVEALAATRDARRADAARIAAEAAARCNGPPN